jgi:hypothetical protein
VGLATVEDDRLPETGQRVFVNMPRAVDGGPSVGWYRVAARDGLKVQLQGEAARAPIPAGVPVVVSLENREYHLQGMVVANPGPRLLEVALKAPPEMRRSKRYPLHLAVALEVVDDQGGAQLNCAATDISAGGAKLRVGARVPLSGLAFVTVKLPDGSPVMAVGEVLDCVMQPYEHDYTVRLRFTCMSRDNAERITAFLAGLDRESRPE